MKKSIKKELKSKFNTELPEGLQKDKIMELLPSEESAPISLEAKRPSRSKKIKVLAPIAASLAVCIGLGAMFINNQHKISQPDMNSEPQVQEVKADSYDEIYQHFSSLQKKAKLENFFSGTINDFAMKEGSAEMNGAPSEGTSANDSLLTEESYRSGETNTQEKGVDEGCIIKTDGRYIYTISSDGARLTIADSKGNKAVSTLKLDFEGRELYINGDRLAVVGVKPKEEPEAEAAADTLEKYRVYNGCIMMFTVDTAVAVYDISDKENVKKVKDFVQQGDFNTSRMIGTILYTVSGYNVDLSADNITDTCIPEITCGTETVRIAEKDIAVVKDTESSSYIVLSAYDLTNGEKPCTNAVLGGCDMVYASQSALFAAETKYGKTPETKIYKFDYTKSGIEYKASAQFDGYLNDRFSLNFSGGYLKAAVTRDVISENKGVRTFDGTVNTLYVLNDKMECVGKLDNLAQNETIKSARYVGNTAYVVTFRQTDPLFVIDLSDPANPKVTGELKIEGFSQYLHPYADGLLIGIGEDGTTEGVNGSCKVSLFDVSQPASPTEISKLTVERENERSGYVENLVGGDSRLYVDLKDGSFAVPFGIFAPNQGQYLYISYTVRDGKLYENARYYIDSFDDVIYHPPLGATFIDNTLYVNVLGENGGRLVCIDMASGETVAKIDL